MNVTDKKIWRGYPPWGCSAGCCAGRCVGRPCSAYDVRFRRPP